jgi:hypothetical protein
MGLTAQKVSGMHLRLLRADNTTGGLDGTGSASVPVTIPADTGSNLVTEISYHIWSGVYTRTFYTPHR